MLELTGGYPRGYRRVTRSVFIDHVNTGLEVSYQHPYGFRAGDYEVLVAQSHRSLWTFLDRLRGVLDGRAYDQLVRSIWVVHTRNRSLRVSYTDRAMD